ncbi:MAG TPA: gephyrin-like molybdotransferase Glp [Paracoccaceae bacterium]|nr:gephyrin-like molybdotransferase Glp [Paracoccaceae bacterium]
MTGRLRDDCFALPPGIHWTPVDEALARLRQGVGPITDIEEIPLAGAAGRILAEPAFARRSNPPAANSAIDGYAFAWASLGGRDEGNLPLEPGRAAAGSPFSGRLPDGHALRILTGAEIPAGADTVVMQEDASVGAGRVRFDAPRKQGANCRGLGEDAEKGEEMLPAGRKLNAADLARLAVVGVDRVTVYKPLRIAILSTGDELLQPGDDPAGPGIFDANRPMLAALVNEWNHVPIDLGAMPDRASAIREALDRGAAEADAILTTGGASTGDEDHVSRLIREEGRVETWRIAVKPGRPLALGLWRGVPVFGLPGNPVAAFITALIFARPAFSVMAGGGWVEPQAFIVPAGFEKNKKHGRREYLRARLTPDGVAEAFRSEGSGLVGGLSWADGLVELPDEGGEFRPGTPVRYLPWTSFGLRA